MIARIKLARLEKLEIPLEEIDAAEDAINDWREIKERIDELDAEFRHDNPDVSDCRAMAQNLGDIKDAANVLTSVIEEGREAVVLVLVRAEVEDAEREYYHALMKGKNKKTIRRKPFVMNSSHGKKANRAG